MESLSSTNPTTLLLFIRHGERSDQTDKLTEKDMQVKWPKCDPAITENGKAQARLVGEKVNAFLSSFKNGIYDECILNEKTFKTISSPFVRTL